MSNVFTITTELKLNREYNQLVGKYISDYIELFNKIQRLTFHRIKNYHIKNGKITLKDKGVIYAQLKEEFNLTSRAIDAILSNMLGRFESIKELKEFERKSLERKISALEKDLTKLKDERTLQRVSLNNNSKNFNFTKYKNLKIKIYWKQNRLNTKKQKLKNLEKELDLTLACQLGEMRVKDLNKGYVKLDAYFFCGAKYTSYWDGEHIKVVFKDFKKYEYMLIKPTDDVYVTVVDENTLKFD